jgi:hypothetical protein
MSDHTDGPKEVLEAKTGIKRQMQGRFWRAEPLQNLFNTTLSREEEFVFISLNLTLHMVSHLTVAL